MGQKVNSANGEYGKLGWMEGSTQRNHQTNGMWFDHAGPACSGPSSTRMGHFCSVGAKLICVFATLLCFYDTVLSPFSLFLSLCQLFYVCDHSCFQEDQNIFLTNRCTQLLCYYAAFPHCAKKTFSFLCFNCFLFFCQLYNVNNALFLCK